ncbi:hypothetical protein BPOR_0743g00080 [Botrytis porri]|uniref:Uncharacterized protein n=1 Tax=Botrytis porri TaxID=87229 RepID=A0A4Z1KBZ6_9HELO|nr:hypothetical protein BPOR_0743g00080 [Botrytis porri]
MIEREKTLQVKFSEYTEFSLFSTNGTINVHRRGKTVSAEKVPLKRSVADLRKLNYLNPSEVRQTASNHVAAPLMSNMHSPILSILAAA